MSFETANLAALCNSERLMADRWGTNMARTIGRRLLDVVASTASTLDRIPTAEIEVNRRGETVIRFASDVVVRGRVERSEASLADDERFVIASLEVQGRKA